MAISAIKTARWRQGPSTIRKANQVTIEGRMKDHLQMFQADLSMRILAQQKAAGTFPANKKDYVVVVDRRHNASELNVRYGGKISYLNNSATFLHILAWIGEQIYRNSPRSPKIGRGNEAWRGTHYQDAHILLVDGKAVQGLDVASLSTNTPSGGFGLDAKVKSAKKYQIINPMPYARRIEHGSGSTKGMKAVGSAQASQTRRRHTGPWSMQAPNGVYRLVAKAAAARFGAAVRIKYQRSQIPATGYSFSHGGKQVAQWYPSIIIRPRNEAKLS